MPDPEVRSPAEPTNEIVSTARIAHLTAEVARRLGSRRAIQILPYRGYGTRQELRLMGRVLRGGVARPAGDDDTAWDNLLRTYRRFQTAEVPGARVEVKLGDAEQVAETDREGYFDVRVPTHHLASVQRWQEVRLELAHPRHGRVAATCESLIPTPEGSFGVISDVDDTVIETGANGLLKAVRNLLFKNARTRLAFPGIEVFYRALQRGLGGPPNPIFYVSNGPWNLYDLLVDFMELKGIPKGRSCSGTTGFVPTTSSRTSATSSPRSRACSTPTPACLSC